MSIERQMAPPANPHAFFFSAELGAFLLFSAIVCAVPTCQTVRVILLPITINIFFCLRLCCILLFTKLLVESVRFLSE